MIRFEDETKIIGDFRYFCDKNGEVFTMQSNGNNGYEVVAFKDDKMRVVEYPTNEQKLYALLNYIWFDNLTNHNKTGIYHKMDEQIIDEFNWFFVLGDKSNLTTSSVFARFGLNPTGEIQQSALNTLVKDVVLENKKIAKVADIEYVIREEAPVAVELLEKAKDKKIYMVMPNPANCGFKICTMNGLVVANPTQYQKENALLNLVIADNITNPSKTGYYNKHSDMIKDAIESELYYLKEGKFDTDKFLNEFGLYFPGELMSNAVNALVDSIKENKEEKAM